jgi:hypothetical protein
LIALIENRSLSPLVFFPIFFAQFFPIFFAQHVHLSPIWVTAM